MVSGWSNRLLDIHGSFNDMQVFTRLFTYWLIRYDTVNKVCIF